MRHRDVLPLPVPFPSVGKLGGLRVSSRSIQRKLRAKVGWQLWANQLAETLSELHVGVTQWRRVLQGQQAYFDSSRRVSPHRLCQPGYGKAPA